MASGRFWFYKWGSKPEGVMVLTFSNAWDTDTALNLGACVLTVTTTCAVPGSMPASFPVSSPLSPQGPYEKGIYYPHFTKRQQTQGLCHMPNIMQWSTGIARSKREKRRTSRNKKTEYLEDVFMEEGRRVWYTIYTVTPTPPGMSK